MNEVQTMPPEKQWDYVPLLYRAKELYICPTEHGWETRYYMTLFGEKKHVINDIITNYMEGLEWVFYYYTRGCVDWKWKYNYHYPPLLKDIAKCKMHPIIQWSSGTTACSPTEQLMYVLPPAYWKELIPDISGDIPLTNVQLEWSFCKYMWEAHIYINK